MVHGGAPSPRCHGHRISHAMTTAQGLREPLLASVTRPAFERFARSVFRVWCPLHVEGREHLPKLPFIICSNHSSHMDSVVLIAAAGFPFTRFAMLAASDYFFRNAIVFSWFASMVRIIPLDRAASPEAFQRTLALCRDFTADGRNGLIFFPEGTRSRAGVMGPFRRGAALFAAELGLPVVPAHIQGTGDALPIGHVFPRRRPVYVRFARPLQPPRTSVPEERDSFLKEMRGRILALGDTVHGV
jgi:1-acyl-sn-glycerol-3-phosphate acyltransferase